MKVFKNYDVLLENGKSIPLMAKNNKEAMKLTGAIAKFDAVVKVADSNGNIIINNGGVKN